MLSKCANPACHARFLYLREGKIFNIEIKTETPGPASPFKERIEHFWLCESCAQVFKVVWENGAVNMRLRHLALTDGKPAQSSTKREAA